MKRISTKLLALGISVSLCSAALSGCGGNKASTTPETQASVQTEAQASDRKSVV